MGEPQMSLFEMSANVQKTASLKRSHDDFVGDDVVKKEHEGGLQAMPPSVDQLTLSSTTASGQLSPCLSPGLTDGGSSTPARHSPSPLTPSKMQASETNNQTNGKAQSSTAQKASQAPAPKRKRLTAEEKEKREKEDAEKKKEREEKLRQKAEEKAKSEKEKAARASEREEKRKKKEEEDRVKAQQRDEKKQQKEEEMRRKQEAEEKKAKSQPSLKSFFGAPRTAKESSTGPSNSPQKATPSSSTGARANGSGYAKIFQPFFVKEHTRMAEPANQMDDETREVKSRILDEYISGHRKHELCPFDPVKLLDLPSRPPRRGRVHHPVRHIMETAYKAMETAQGSGGEADNIMREARRKLARIPVKVIAFSRDVRPPYYGTATYKPFVLGKPNLRVLARRPVGRTLELDYDYDSEAEWQEEEGEDVDIDDDEEELDDEDDMDGFLDDSEDAGLARRIFANTMEPESTGICFESSQRPDPIMQDHKMEYIHELLGSDKPIDPWSTSYWEADTKKTTVAKSAPSTDQPTKMAPPPAPANAFAVLSKPVTASTDAVKLVKDDILDDVKRAILANKLLSKVGMVDVVYQQFRDRSSRAEVKNTIEVVAEKKKGASKLKEWELKPGHELKL